MNGSLDNILRNTASGFQLMFPSGCTSDELIRLTRSHAGVSTQNVIRIDNDSEACLFLLDLGNSNSDSTDLYLGEGAVFHLVRVQMARNSLSTHLRVRQQAESLVCLHYLTLSGDMVSNTIEVTLDGEGAEHFACGLALTEDTEEVSNKVVMVHAAPDCSSNQLFRNILADRSRGTFEGSIVVKPEAQRTAAYQRSNNILLSDDARMSMMPHLEINADDVKCSHGATAGQLDREALFYLRSRGIPQQEAGRMLLQAFAEEVFTGIDADAVRDEILQFVEHKLLKINLK